ncbi:MAG: restriction endonuclease [Clostridiales bacterium]|nr:restriction endonuclease [Clostridiales bacterium]
MAVPKFEEFFRDFLDVLADGAIHSNSDVRESISAARALSAEDLQQLLPSGGQTVFSNRVNWAGIYLNKAGLISRVARGKYVITPEGKKLQESPSITINTNYLLRYPSFAAFQNKTASDTESPSPSSAEAQASKDTSTPQDTIKTAFKKLNTALADELMDEIMAQSPDFFEKLVVRLLLKMGYGGSFDGSGIKTQRTGDGGIDGIIKEDKLGFSQIYIQAKRWNPETTVSRPEIQKFSGALQDQGASRGLFITTAHFSNGAKESAERQHIVLVDGEKLAELMIEYNVGVSVSETYSIKKLDTDFFNEDSL